MEPETTKIPLEALLKFSYKKIKQKDAEIAQLNQTIGELQSYIAELEDADEREARIRKRKEQAIDLDRIAMKETVNKQRALIRSQKNTIDNLMAKLNKYETRQ